MQKVRDREWLGMVATTMLIVILGITACSSVGTGSESAGALASTPSLEAEREDVGTMVAPTAAARADTSPRPTQITVAKSTPAPSKANVPALVPTSTATTVTTISPTQTPTVAAAPPAVRSTSTRVPTGVTPRATPSAVPQSPAPLPSAAVPGGTGVLADHRIIGQFDQIPSAALAAASAKRVLFMHASVGQQLSFAGLNCLQGTRNQPECAPYPDYKYDRRNWTWELYTLEGSKLSQFENAVNSRHADFDIFAMKFCYIDTFQHDFGPYRDMMLRLEAAYPDKTFIWVTQAVSQHPDWVNGSGGQVVQRFNQELRAYAQANNKALYDLAAIESHDPDGNPCYAGVEQICPQYSADLAGHPNKQQGSIRLAKGFWWLMARIAGWN